MRGKPYPLVQVNDILLHKALVFLVGSLLVRHYMESGDKDSALRVGKIITLHDMSKWEADEFDGMCQYQKFLSLKDDSYPTPPPDAQAACDLHFSRNSHHPEFYGQAYNMYMNDDDICEMAVDRFARGLQFTGDPEDVFRYFDTKDTMREQYSKEFKERFLHYLNALKTLYQTHRDNDTEFYQAIGGLLIGLRREQTGKFYDELDKSLSDPEVVTLGK